MNMDEIREIAQYQKENYVEIDDKLHSIGMVENQLYIKLANSVGYFLPWDDIDILGQYLKINGTIADFSRDKEFIMDAAHRRIQKSPRKYGAKLIVDKMKHEIVGLMTKKYQRYYNADVLDHPSFDTMKLDERSSFINKRLMVLNFTTEEVKNMHVGDFAMGFSIVNSETGHAGLIVNPYLIRLQCDNGMTIKIGQKVHEVSHIFTDLHEKLDRMIALVMDDISWIEKINDAADMEFNEDQLDVFLKAYRIPKRYWEEIKIMLGAEDLSLSSFAIYNAMSRMASHNLKEHDSYLLMEHAMNILR